MPKQLTKWLDEFVENGADPSDVTEWPENSGGGGSYTPGNGINIVGNEISVDTKTIATKEDLNDYEPASEAFSGDYNDLDNKPTIPTDTSDLTNGAGFITGITSTDVTTALGYTPGTSNFSGNYDDLNNKPTIPDAVSGTNDGTNWTSLTIGSVTKNIPAGGSGSSYTAGTGIDITNNEISVDNTVAMKTDIPDAVSGEHDSNNWTSLTIGDVTKNIPTSSGSEITTLSGSTINFSFDTEPGIYRVTTKNVSSKITIKLTNQLQNTLASLELDSYYGSYTGDACMYFLWMDTQFERYNNMHRRTLIGFCGSGSSEIIIGSADYAHNPQIGRLEIYNIKTDLINKDLTTYKLSLTFTKDSNDSYMDFIFSNENAISGNIDVATFKALFDTTETLIGDKKLCDINHTVRIYNNGTYTIGDIYYDSATDTFSTVDGTITGLTLSSIVKTEKSHTLPS